VERKHFLKFSAWALRGRGRTFEILGIRKKKGNKSRRKKKNYEKKVPPGRGAQHLQPRVEGFLLEKKKHISLGKKQCRGVRRKGQTQWGRRAATAWWGFDIEERKDLGKRRGRQKCTTTEKVERMSSPRGPLPEAGNCLEEMLAGEGGEGQNLSKMGLSFNLRGGSKKKLFGNRRG